MSNSKLHTLITGASSGIGADFAKLAAQGGDNLILVARSTGKMDELAKELISKYGIEVEVIGSDLSKPEAPKQLFEATQEKGLAVDKLVNNAGYGVSGSFLTTDGDDELDMIQVNISALTSLAKLYAPEMVKRGSGKIMNVASTAAFQPGPGLAVYCATKSYVKSFSEALASELKGTGVTCTCLCPGATKTGFADRADMNDSMLFKMTAMESPTVAAKGWRAMQNGKKVIVTGILNKLMAWSVAFTPRPMVLWVAKNLMAH